MAATGASQKRRRAARISHFRSSRPGCKVGSQSLQVVLLHVGHAQVAVTDHLAELAVLGPEEGEPRGKRGS